MTKSKLLCLLLVLAILTGCAPTGLPAPSTDTTGEQTQEQALFSRLFDTENRITIALHMEQAELEKLQQDYTRYQSRGSKSPIYRMADMDITIESSAGTEKYHLEQVGVRMKGNTSRTDFYTAEQGITGLIHLKLSFQETFDDPDYYGSDALTWAEADRAEREDRTFAGLSKLDLKWNRCDDTSYIREIYAYDAFRTQGLLAPHANLASVDWSGLHMGVYTIYEPVDKKFLKRNLPSEQLGGDLYKLGWTSEGASFTSVSSMGVEDEDAGEFFVYDLKTNKKTSDHAALCRLIEQLNREQPDRDTLEQLVDMDAFLRYAAVSYLLGNPDDLRNNYNNSYIYFRGDTGQMLVIPYDYDRCLGITKHWNPTGDAVTTDSPFTLEMAAGLGQQESPLFLSTVCQGGLYVEEYARLVEQLGSVVLDTARFAEMADRARQLYAGDATPDRQFHNGTGYRFQFDATLSSDFAGQDNISFFDYAQAKLETLERCLKWETSGALQTRYCLRADFTGWDVEPQWSMETGTDGTWQIELTLRRSAQLKVYDRQEDCWFGSERLTQDTTVTWQTDGYTNIILQPGTYRIAFDPTAKQIFITAEG